MLYYQMSGFINCLTSIVVGILILTKDSKSGINRAFSYFAFSVAIWSAAYFCWSTFPDNYDDALMWARLLMVGPIMIPSAFFHFTIMFIGKLPKYKKFMILNYVFSFSLILFDVLTPLVIRSVEPRMIFPYWPMRGPFLTLHLAMFIGIVSYAHWLIFKEYKNLSPLQKNQTKYVFLGTAIGFVGGATNYIPFYDIPFPPIGNILVSLYVLSIAYAILQYRLFDFTFVMRKGAIYTILIGFISVLYVGAMVLLQPTLEGLFGKSSLVSGLLAAVILGIFYAPMRVKIETLVDATIFRSYTEEVSRQKAVMQEELMRSEKFKMVSAITRGIIYEIRNPLTTIKTHGLLIPKRLEDKDFLIKTSSKLDAQVNKINALLQKLLNFSNPSPPEFQPTMIHDVLEEVINIFEAEFIENKIEVKKDFHTKETAAIQADAVQVRQAIYNIIHNAIEAMVKKGGTLTISTEIKEGSSIRQEVFDSSTVKSYYEITISDTGVGISEGNLQSIFDPFYSPEEKKTGLGLSITHKIVKQHKGFIFAESEIGKGATFIIELPLK